MVLLRDTADLPVPRIEQELRTRYPDLHAAIAESEGAVAVLQLKNGRLMLACMPCQIPWSDLEGPCATSILWKNAADEVKTHAAHVVVSIATELNPVEQSILLTQVTTAVLAACDSALGVYWGNATLLVPKPVFVEFAEKMLPEGPPLYIWVDFRVGWQTARTSAGFTTGMAALGHMDMEARDWPAKPSDLRDRFMNFAFYVLENGPVIKDRDTIGQDASEKIRAVYAPGTFGQNARVIQLRYEAAPAKPWWKIW
jgi:Domain of unknown function (DUF4261)